MRSPAVTHPPLTDAEVQAKLRALSQEKLLAAWSVLSTREREELRKQITQLDPHLLHRLQTVTPIQSHAKLEPFTAYVPSGNSQLQSEGRNLIQTGKVALVVLAGGQGSRLRFEGPKGCYPVTLIKHKSLFQLLAEKVKAAGNYFGRVLQVAIMTSPLNDEETKGFFAENAFFGLDPSQVTFFSQKMWPLIDFSGQIFLESPQSIAQGPNGNGGVFQGLVEAGIWENWSRSGIEMAQVIPIDNPLADPFDAELFGAHAAYGCEATIKAAFKRSAHEKVGVLAQVEGKTTVVEYSEMSRDEKEAIDKDGKLKFGIANLTLLCFSMPFIERMSLVQMPLHQARKAVKMLDSKGHVSFPEEANALKFEQFIFDVLPYASRVEAIIYPRERCFAPLKNLKGEDSIESVQAALLAADGDVYERVSGGIKPPAGARFELAPQFYYPTEHLLAKWKGSPFPNKEYIDD